MPLRGLSFEHRRSFGAVKIPLFVGAALVAYGLTYSQRTYWPYLLAGYLMACFAYVRDSKRQAIEQPQSLIEYLFPKEIWRHPSSLVDGVVALINLAVILVVFRYVMIEPQFFMRIWHKLGLPIPSVDALRSPTAPPSLRVLIVYTLLTFMASDFMYYLSHRITHKVPWMWELHKVHHSAQVMTPLTLYRAHPLDMWFNTVCRNFGVGCVAAIFLCFYPNVRGVITIAGINAFVFVANILGANLRHSHIWIHFGWWDRIIISPAQHQIHHSTNPIHFDKNFGSTLALWDWMLGTLVVPHDNEVISFGLATRDEEVPYKDLWGIFVHPLSRIFCFVRRKV